MNGGLMNSQTGGPGLSVSTVSGLPSASQPVVGTETVPGLQSGVLAQFALTSIARATTTSGDGVVNGEPTPTSAGVAGDRHFSSTAIYLCWATNTWVRWLADGTYQTTWTIAAAFSPLNISGITHFIDLGASGTNRLTLSGSNVANVYNRVGTPAVFGAAAGAAQPVYNATAFGSGADQGGASFDGTNHSLSATAAVVDAGGDYTYWFAGLFRPKNTTLKAVIGSASDSYINVNTGSGGSITVAPSSGSSLCSFPTGITPSTSNTTVVAFVVEWKGADQTANPLVMWFNGNTIGASGTDISRRNPQTASLKIGNIGGFGSYLFQGDINCILAGDGALSTQDATNLRSWLMTRAGL